MNIGGKKRVRSLDDAKEVLITHRADGTPIWTTVGDNRMTGDNKAELSSNLAAARHQAEVVKTMRYVQESASAFFEAMILQVAPQAVLDDYAAHSAGQSKGSLFLEWFEKSGFGYKQDGLKSVVTYKGRVLSEMTATVDPRLAQDVINMLAFDASLVRLEQAQA